MSTAWWIRNLRRQGRARTPTTIDLGEPIPPEWDLRCTGCDYNLTGLTNRICPECGQPFWPLQTWQANREARRPRYLSLRRLKERTSVITIVCGLATSVLVHYSHLWTWAVVLWVVFELRFWQYDADTYYLRLFFLSLIAGTVLLGRLL